MKVTVIGAGGWGTALSILLFENGHDVTLWIYDTETYDNIQAFRENKLFLPGVTIPLNVKISNLIEEVIEENKVIILSVPVPFLRGILEKIKHLDLKDKIICNSAKGIEVKTKFLPYQIIQKVCPSVKSSNISTISGPSHAEEAARGRPTNLISASKNIKSALLIAKLFQNSSINIKTSTDIIGVELGASLKNIIAIALGICDGLNLGDNSKAAVLIKGLDQISALGKKVGAIKETFFGLAGLGDIVVTGYSHHSRNHFIGEEIGKGTSLRKISKGMKMVAEGVSTTKSAYFFQKKYKMNLPIITQMYKVLYERKDPKTAIEDILKNKM